MTGKITMQQIREAMSRFVWEIAIYGMPFDRKLLDIYSKPPCQAKTMTYEDFMKGIEKMREEHP